MSEEDVWVQLSVALTEIESLWGVLEQERALLDEAQGIMRKHGFRFETSLNEIDGWEKLAFTFYTLLCQADAAARDAVEESRRNLVDRLNYGARDVAGSTS